MSDLIFCDADIITMDDANPSAQAIRIQGNRIKEIGSNNKILGTKNDDTVIISAKGKSEVLNIFDLRNSIKSKKSFGGTSFENIKKMIDKYKKEIKW